MEIGSLNMFDVFFCAFFLVNGFAKHSEVFKVR